MASSFRSKNDVNLGNNYLYIRIVKNHGDFKIRVIASQGNVFPLRRQFFSIVVSCLSHTFPIFYFKLSPQLEFISKVINILFQLLLIFALLYLASSVIYIIHSRFPFPAYLLSALLIMNEDKNEIKPNENWNMKDLAIFT